MKYHVSQKLQKKQDDESVCKKVKLIKDIIRSREIENARLKRLVEQGENDEINQLRTEIERLKEVRINWFYIQLSYLYNFTISSLVDVVFSDWMSLYLFLIMIIYMLYQCDF